MQAKHKLWKEESGQAMILVALLFVVICVFAAFVIDIGRVSVEKTNLQNAADAAAMAGAQDLPNASIAVNAAVHNAERNGVETTNITVTCPYNGDSTLIEVVCTQTVEYTFARVLGFTSKEVSARAVARKTGMSRGPFGYAVFSGSQSNQLNINGSNQYISGSVHSNYNFLINGSGQTITGNAEAVSSLTANGSSISIGGTCQGSPITLTGSNISVGNKVYSAASVIDMPDFSATIQSEADAAGTKYTGNKTYNGSNINVDSPIYVDGNIAVNGSNFSGKGIILASGNITFNGSNLKSSSTASVCFYSESGNITINGSNIELYGIVYAPNGTITMSGSNQTINGRVIGNNLLFYGSNIRITSGASDLDCLPENSVKLVN